MPGAISSTAEVTNISRHGFWLLVDGKEHFLAFDDFPWFREAPVDAILQVPDLLAAVVVGHFQVVAGVRILEHDLGDDAGQRTFIALLIVGGERMVSV